MKPCPLCGSTEIKYERRLNTYECHRCTRCSHVFADTEDETASESNKEYYTASGIDSFEDRNALMDTLWFRAIAEKIEQITGRGKIMDVGCGNGMLLRQFKEKGWEVVGSDLSPKARFYGDKYGYQVHVGGIEEFPLQAGSFTAITGTNVIEHVPRPGPFLKKTLALLRSGGVAYFNLPHYNSLSIRLGWSAFFRNQPPMHIHFFTRASFKKLVADPAIAGSVASVKIRTYGIPEIHRTLNFFKTLRQRAFKDWNTRTDTASAREVSADEMARWSSQFKRMAFAFLIAVYYYCGRLLYIGDKLEVIIVKK